MKVLMMGTEAAGKTALLYRLKMGQSLDTIPTVGFNVEEIQVAKQAFIVTDLSIPNMFTQQIDQQQGLIFVIDGTQDQDSEAKELFTNVMQLLNDRRIPVAIVFSKADLRKPDLEKQKEYFELKEVIQTFQLFSCSSVTGEGLENIFAFLAANQGK